MFWEDHFTLVSMKSCRRRNVRKPGEIKNGEQYIILYISSNPDFMDKTELISSESNYYIGRPGKGMTTSLALKTKSLNNKQNEGFEITDIMKQYSRKLLG